MFLLGIWQSIMDKNFGKVLPFYEYYGLIYKLILIAGFVLIASMATEDRRVLVIVAILAGLLAFGYLPI